MAPTRSRFGLLGTVRTPEPWEQEVVAKLRDAGAELVLVVLSPRTRARPGPFARFAERLASGGRAAPSSGTGAEQVPIVRLDDPQALEAIRSHDLDFLLALEPTDRFPSLVEASVPLAREGIWTCAFASDGSPAAPPPGFDTVMNGRPLVTVSLARVTAPGVGLALGQEWLRVEPCSYRQTRRALTGSAADLVTRRVTHGASADEGVESVRLPVSPGPGEFAAVRLLVRLGARASRRMLHRALYRQDWNVGMLARPISSALDGLEAVEIEWLPVRPGDAFLADPFGIPLASGRVMLLAEEFLGRTRRGRIVAAEIEGARYAKPPRPVLELDGHLSYPFVLSQDEGAWSFVPESSRAAEVTEYRLHPGADRAERGATLLEGFPAVDPTVFVRDGRWWLFATDGARGEDGHLHAWYGDSPRGPWTAHEHNPVKCDVRTARPAGTPFSVDGTLYRPAQDNSTTYGGAVVINRIDRLTPSAFDETTVARIAPDPKGPYPAGIHTISGVGGITLVDGKRFRFDPFAKVRRRLRR